MTKVRFTKDFDFKPSDQSTIAYKAGWSGTVTQACAKAAEAAKVGEIIEANSAPKLREKGTKDGDDTAA